MSSPEQPSPEKTSPDWDAIERDFRAGSRAVTSIAAEHGITEGAIRKRAKRDGWVRLPKDKASTETKAPKVRTAPAKPTLDPRHQRFVDEYLIDLNGTQAAIRAGYSANSAVEQAYDLLRKPQIKAAIEASQKRLQDKLEIKAESVVRQLALIATADPRELIEVRVGCCRYCHGAGHFDYRSNNRPRVMQGNAARVLLLFKQYGQNMVYTLARSAQQSLKGASQQERAEARKTLGGLLVMHGLAAGALGLPMVTTLLAAASMLGGDDDEPWDAQVALQNMLADTFGQKPAEVMAHGLSRLTPWDISGRVGLDRLIFPDIQEGLEGQRLGESAMAAALGPVAGIGINVLKGLQDMGDGRYQRGLETMAPSALRGPLKAWRYETEGVKDKSGIVVQDEVDAAELLGQASGFSPSSVRNSFEGKSAIIQHDRALQARRSTLVEQFAMAAMSGDEEGKADARADIAKFNEKNPGRRIQPLQLAQSVRMRTKRIEHAQEGVYLPAKRRDALEAGRFAAGG